MKIPEQSRLAIWRALQDLKQGGPLQLPATTHHHDYHGQQLIRSSGNMTTSAMAAIGGPGGELQRQRVMEAVHFRVRHTITIPHRSGVVGTSAAGDEWADFGFDMPDCKLSCSKHSIKEEFMESDVHWAWRLFLPVTLPESTHLLRETNKNKHKTKQKTASRVIILSWNNSFIRKVANQRAVQFDNVTKL